MKDFKFRLWNETENKKGPIVCMDFSDGRNFTPIVMQWTGLKDRHGTDIYDGDVLEDNSYGEYSIAVVQWNEDTAAFELHYELDDVLSFADIYLDCVKVIRNIYEKS